MNYWVIGAIVLVLGIFANIALRKGWTSAALLALVLEVQARAARARQWLKDRKRP